MGERLVVGQDEQDVGAADFLSGGPPEGCGQRRSQQCATGEHVLGIIRIAPLNPLTRYSEDLRP